MKNFIAPVYIETNPMSKETLACGLLAIMPDGYLFHWAKKKVDMAEKLAGPDYANYFGDVFQALQTGIQEEHDKKLAKGALFDEKGPLSPEHFAYLKQYDAGPVQFGEIKPFAGPMDKEVFRKLFHEIVFEEPERKASPPTLRSQLKKRLDSKRLQARADVNYTLPENKIPNYLGDASIMVTSVNGSLYTAQPLDLANRVNYLADRVRIWHTLQHALHTVAARIKKPLEPMQLVIGASEPEGEHADLVNKVKQYMSNTFQVVNTAHFEERLDKVEADPKAQKLSSLLEV